MRKVSLTLTLTVDLDALFRDVKVDDQEAKEVFQREWGAWAAQIKKDFESSSPGIVTVDYNMDIGQ